MFSLGLSLASLFQLPKLNILFGGKIHCKDYAYAVLNVYPGRIQMGRGGAPFPFSLFYIFYGNNKGKHLMKFQ